MQSGAVGVVPRFRLDCQPDQVELKGGSCNTWSMLLSSDRLKTMALDLWRRVSNSIYFCQRLIRVIVFSIFRYIFNNDNRMRIDARRSIILGLFEKCPRLFMALHGKNIAVGVES